jgi:hypothetical protein
MKAHALRLLLLLLTLAAPGVARAGEVRATASLSSDVVEVGEPLNVVLTIEADEDVDPVSPKLSVPPNFQSSPASTSSFRMQFNATFRKTYTARWVLVPNDKGTFTLPSPSVIVDGEVVTAPGTLKLQVVDKGKGPPKQKRPGSPGFAGMGSFFGPLLPFDLDDPFFRYDSSRPMSSEGRDLMLDQGTGEHVFLYIHADKREAVVGEQVTLHYWVYFDVNNEGVIDYREPALADFFRHAIAEPGDFKGPLVTTSVGGKRFFARKFAETAVFPLTAGELHTGKILGKFRATRVDRKNLLERESNDLAITVREPPADARPVGYVLGTVGRFKLAAEVAPRETIAGETVSVSVRVTGIGLMPNELRLPARAGIEWIAPEKKEEISIHGGRVGGWRSFGYAVRFAEAGELDLGNIELPYYDVDKKQYEVATVELGRVVIKPGKGGGDAVPDASESKDPWSTLAAPRTALGPHQPARDEGLAPAMVWTLVATPPLLVALSGAALALGRRVRRRREEQRRSPAVLARRALAEMEVGDAKARAAAAERAIHLAIEAATGLRARALLLDQLGAELTRRGLGELAEPVCALLGRCSDMRFAARDAGDEASPAEARRLVKELLRFEPDPTLGGPEREEVA